MVSMWDEVIDYTERLETRFENDEISREQWHYEGFDFIVDEVRQDFTRLNALRKGIVPVSKDLPTSLPLSLRII